MSAKKSLIILNIDEWKSRFYTVSVIPLSTYLVYISCIIVVCCDCEFIRMLTSEQYWCAPSFFMHMRRLIQPLNMYRGKCFFTRVNESKTPHRDRQSWNNCFNSLSDVECLFVSLKYMYLANCFRMCIHCRQCGCLKACKCKLYSNACNVGWCIPVIC